MGTASRWRDNRTRAPMAAARRLDLDDLEMWGRARGSPERGARVRPQGGPPAGTAGAVARRRVDTAAKPPIRSRNDWHAARRGRRGSGSPARRHRAAQPPTEAGFDVVARPAMPKTCSARPRPPPKRPAVIADINMPPGHGDDGLRAALEVRRRRPETGVLILSQYFEERYALDLIADGAEGLDICSKSASGRSRPSSTRRPGSRMVDPLSTRTWSHALWVAAGDHADRPPQPAGARGPCGHGRGHVEPGIGKALDRMISQPVVEKHITNIFQKLGLPPPRTSIDVYSRSVDICARPSGWTRSPRTSAARCSPSGSVAVMRVPPPEGLSILMLPPTAATRSARPRRPPPSGQAPPTPSSLTSTCS